MPSISSLIDMERFVTTRSSARTAVPSKKLREAQEEDGEASRPTKKPRRQKKVSNTQYSQSTAGSSAGEPEEAPAGDAQGGDESSHRISEYIESSVSDDEIPEGAVPPERIQIRGKWYLKDSGAIKIDRRKKKTSHIWSKGYEIISEVNKNSYFYCTLCLDIKKDFTYEPICTQNGRTPVLKHFERIHRIDSSGNAIKSNTFKASKSPSPSPLYARIVNRFVLDTFRLLLVKWFVYCHIALYQIENPYFIKLLTYLSDGISFAIPKRRALRKWIIDEFIIRRRILRREL
ncbi:hypothetical protein M501DRAFT_1046859 [Patellaria atrata CBS 101060]|uniref:BED-type domain-containing protein n=1 Tax=Patellaria atrata CBS 101060 TaxID=1346257 RepID=A0A9P4VLS3_9PEZI|nr:hypothetical protein M501DRAFT_1046859 [Patellaria atrata CBS 101060]